jgi:hypothetical protein
LDPPKSIILVTLFIYALKPNDLQFIFSLPSLVRPNPNIGLAAKRGDRLFVNLPLWFELNWTRNDGAKDILQRTYDTPRAIFIIIIIFFFFFFFFEHRISSLRRARALKMLVNLAATSSNGDVERS